MPECSCISKLEAECLYKLISNCVALIYTVLLLGNLRSCSEPDRETEGGVTGIAHAVTLMRAGGSRFLSAHDKIKGFLKPYSLQEMKSYRKTFFFVARNPGKTCTIFCCEKGRELVFFFRLFLEMLKIPLWRI